MPNQVYQRSSAVQYAKKYGLMKNPRYPYYQGDNCTNFVSQCLQAGGCENHFHPTHPWWCVGMKTSICWSVAGSLYWYILICTQENAKGIKAKTMSIYGDEKYSRDIANTMEVGDVIQYMNFRNKIQHSAMITGFYMKDGLKHPLVSQNTYEAVDIPWQKGRKKTIFHHILSIN